MVAFADLYTLPTRAQIKARVVSLAEAAKLTVTSWILGEPSERWIEISTRVADSFSSNIVTQTVRMFFLELATDPGDAGDLSADQTPRPGWLSALGSGWYGVQRGDARYATGPVTVTNSGATSATFAPFDLTFERSTAGPDGGRPTYRNAVDPAIYTGLGGTVTLAPGASIALPVICEQVGTYGNATAGQISTVVTQSFGALTCTNASNVIGADREARETYITRCRQQSAAASPNGPKDAYAYASTTGADGNPLQLYDGSGATTVNRVFVSRDSSTGVVTIYLANPSGPATGVEVSSANGNIHGIPIPDPVTGEVHNSDPIGVVPDTVTLAPTASDAITGAPGPAAAIPLIMGPLKGTAKIKAVPGLASSDLVTAVHQAILTNVSNWFATVPIGGLDQVAGAGVVYTSDLQALVRESYPVPVAGQAPTPALYAVNLTNPSTPTTSVSLGRVPGIVLPPTVSAAADNGSGLVRLTVGYTSGITTGSQIQIYNAVTGGGLTLNGVWTVTNINAVTLDLQGSTFPLGGTFTSASLALIIVTVVS